MKIIITERQKGLLEMNLSIKRRISIGEDFIKNLSPNDVCLNWKSSEVNNYVNGVLSDATFSCLDDDDLYDETYDYLSNKYRKYVKDFFYDSLCDDDGIE
jgi:hypothetical protein